MKRPTLCSLFLAATLFLAVEARAEEVKKAAARPAAAPAGSDEGLRYRRMLLTMFDKDRDGRLDETERTAARKHAKESGRDNYGALRADLVKRFDRNGDGKLDGAETVELRRTLREPDAVNPRPATPAASATTAPAEPAELNLDFSPTEIAQLQKVADEVAKNQAERRQRAESAHPAEAPASAPMGLSGAEMEIARLERVAETVKRRQAEREKAQRAMAEKK